MGECAPLASLHVIGEQRHDADAQPEHCHSAQPCDCGGKRELPVVEAGTALAERGQGGKREPHR